jgi:RHS repeat-associated protein
VEFVPVGEEGETEARTTEFSVFYFAGRPVAQVKELDSITEWVFLTTDHLGTPLLATDLSGNDHWAGPFEPFGKDFFQVAQPSDIFLRLPGQWNDPIWQNPTAGAGIYYNVHRWYEAGTGRYTRPDPVTNLGGVHPIRFDSHPYRYADANPFQIVDRLGLYGSSDCTYYSQRCRECGGDYYCRTAPFFCDKLFPKPPDPDPSREDDYEGWFRCTRKCLQDCDQASFEQRRRCDPSLCSGGAPDPATDSFTDRINTRCHMQCYSSCWFWGSWGGGEPAATIPSVATD